MAGRPPNIKPSHRVNLTLQDDVYKQLMYLVKLTDTKKATLVNDLISEFLPIVTTLIDSLMYEQKNDKDLMIHSMDDAYLLADFKMNELASSLLELKKKHGTLNHSPAYDNLTPEQNKETSDDRLVYSDNPSKSL